MAQFAIDKVRPGSIKEKVAEYFQENWVGKISEAKDAYTDLRRQFPNISGSYVTALRPFLQNLLDQGSGRKGPVAGRPSKRERARDYYHRVIAPRGVAPEDARIELMAKFGLGKQESRIVVEQLKEQSNGQPEPRPTEITVSPDHPVKIETEEPSLTIPGNLPEEAHQAFVKLLLMNRDMALDAAHKDWELQSASEQKVVSHKRLMTLKSMIKDLVDLV